VESRAPALAEQFDENETSLHQIHIGAIDHNVSQIGDVALSPTRAKGHVAERHAAAPRSPRRLLRRRCTYELLYAVAPLSLAK
jgi:hypothetical protein